MRSWLLATLLPPTIDRISVNLGGGVGIAVVAEVLNAGGSPVWVVAVGPVSALVPCLVIRKFLQWLVATTSGSSPRRRRDLLIVCGALFMLGLPNVLVLMFGTWACLLTQRVRGSRFQWVRYAEDVFVAALTGLAFLLRFDRDLLATQPAAGLFFLVGAWFAIRVWRVMVGSRHPAVRAGADIALSLLLGVDLVLFLVWGANLLDLSESEVAVLRGTLEQVGSVADLPWPLWVGIYVVLAGASLAFVLWPERLAAITGLFQRLHVVSSIDTSRRVLTDVHISLLVIVLIAVSAPASLEAMLRGQLKAKYNVALQRELESLGKQAAYEEIHRQFTTGTSTSPSVQPLVVIVRKIHSISSPAPGTNDATSTERDLARRLGQIQATTLQLTATQSVLSASRAVTDLARFDSPIRDADDLNDRLGRLERQQQRADTVTRLVDQAAELATTAVANMIQLPGLGENEIVQIIREYLSGLVENSQLKEVFAAWAERLTSDITPPRADKMVIPDPEKLEQAARTALTQKQARDQLADPSTPDQVQTRTQTESPADAAVDLTNEARHVDERAGPCNECPQPIRPGDEHYDGPGYRPMEPVRPVELPRIRFHIFW